MENFIKEQKSIPVNNPEVVKYLTDKKAKQDELKKQDKQEGE